MTGSEGAIEVEYLSRATGDVSTRVDVVSFDFATKLDNADAIVQRSQK